MFEKLSRMATRLLGGASSADGSSSGANRKTLSVDGFCEETLDEFVAMVDAKGGPPFLDSAPEWRSLSYRPSVKVDTAVDPFSDAYFALQTALYKEISGRDINQSANEKTDFNFEDHVASPNPYGGRDPNLVAIHYVRLSKLMRFAAPPAHARVLDMGCGWGLSTELFATMGCKVTGVDINPSFVGLVNERNKRLKLDIEAFQGGFDDFPLTGEFDLVVFYECLHHALKPWDVIARLSRNLAPGGSLAFAGEPINTLWWPHWGMRLDPLSVYCIRKFGWFESGWSQEFITQCMTRSGLAVRFVADADPVVGTAMVGTRPLPVSPAA